MIIYSISKFTEEHNYQLKMIVFINIRIDWGDNIYNLFKYLLKINTNKKIGTYYMPSSITVAVQFTTDDFIS